MQTPTHCETETESAYFLQYFFLKKYIQKFLNPSDVGLSGNFQKVPFNPFSPGSKTVKTKDVKMNPNF